MQHTLLHLEHAKATAARQPDPPPPRSARQRRRRLATLLVRIAWRLDHDAVAVHRHAKLS